MRDDFGPYWTVNSEEAGSAFFIWAVIILSPIIPAAVLGYVLGDAMGGVNIIKWGMALAFAAAAVWIYIKVYDRFGWLGFAILYIGQWLLLDIFYAAAHHDTPVMFRVLGVFFSWAVAK